MRFRVAVIDDDASFRGLVLSLLKVHFETTSASDGGEGLAMLIENPPDLVVMDVHLPRIDGLSVLRSMRSHPKLQNLPVVILTADASRETVMAAVNSGATDFIIKTTFTADELNRKIRRALKIDEDVASVTPAIALATAPHIDSILDSVVSEPTPTSDDAELQAILDAWE